MESGHRVTPRFVLIVMIHNVKRCVTQDALEKVKVYIKTGFRTSGLRHIPLELALEGIAKAGFNTVEFCLEHPQASPLTLQFARNLGLEISAVSYHGKRDDDTTRLVMGEKAIKMAAECSVDTVVMGSPINGLDKFLLEVDKLYALSHNFGIKPAWETEPGTILDGLDEFYRYIVPLGAGSGINLDAGHLHLQNSCTSTDIERLGDRIFHVHVEGMKKTEHKHLIPGEGDLNWRELFDGLSKAGYNQSLTIDLFEIPSNWSSYLYEANVAMNTVLYYV